jgi:CelD/BcsL family acetyltransferase involved in cellulose biosynthesis
VRAFGGGKLHVITVRRGGDLVGVLPLTARRGVLRSPANWHTPEFGPLLTPGVRPEFLRYLLNRFRRTQRISLRLMTVDSNELEWWRTQATIKGCRVLSRVEAEPMAIDLQGCRDWPDFERGLSANLRSDLRRSGHRLAELGDVSLDVHEECDSRQSALLDEGLRVEHLGWKAAAGTAIESKPETETFYRDVAAWAAARGSLRLTFLRSGAKTVAFMFAIHEHGVQWEMKAGYDPAFKACGPGKILIQEVVKDGLARGSARIELGQVEDYKRRWANTSRQLHRLEVFPASPRGYAQWLAFSYARPAVRAGINRLPTRGTSRRARTV